jgi:hypothetical protein
MVGLSMVKDESTGKTMVTICYPEDIQDDYFVLEYYDEVLKRWVPYDGQYGIVKKE